MPDGNPASTVNCWKMILLVAIQVGVLDRATVHNWYANGNIKETEFSQSLATFGSFLQASCSWAITSQGELILAVASPESLILLKIDMP